MHMTINTVNTYRPQNFSSTLPSSNSTRMTLRRRLRVQDPDSMEGDRVHRLAPEYVDDINSPLRHVRTRIYFTSESHIHSLINILRYNKIDGESLLSEEGHKVLNETREYDYLTQIVLRMYENKSVRGPAFRSLRSLGICM